MKYQIEQDKKLEDYNTTARKVVFEEPLPETPEHGLIKEAVIVNQVGGIGSRIALFIDDQLFIEGLYEDALFWRLAQLSTNFEVEIEKM